VSESVQTVVFLFAFAMTTLTLVLFAFVMDRKGYTIISAFVAAAAWLSLGTISLLLLMNEWGLLSRIMHFG
jgi:hypothetical protein